jgi:hypothetical protein
MTAAEIRQQVEADWVSHLSVLRKAYAVAFLKACERKGVKACALHRPGSDAISLPVFGDLTIEIPRQQLLEIIQASPRPEYAEQQVDMLAGTITASLSANQEQFLVEGADLERVETMRQMLLQEINRSLKTLPSQRKALEGLLTPLTPAPLAESLRGGLYHLERAEAFAKEYRTFLQAQTPKGPSSFTSKGKRRKHLTDSPEWTPVMAALVQFFGDGEPHLLACKRAAEVLAVVFPRIWGAQSIKESAQVIRNRTRP